jgi:sugar transferase (PEP-CTERM system associated)
LREGSSSRRLLLPLLDSAILVAAFVGAVYLRFDQNFGKVLVYEGVLPKTLVSVFVVQLCLYYAGLYEDLPLQRPFDTAMRFVQSFLAGLLVLLTVYYLFPDLKVGRGVLGLYLALGMVGVLFSRTMYLWLGEEEKLADNVLIIGTGSTAQKIAREILQRRPWGLRVAGFLADDPAEVGRKIVGPTVIGTVDELPLVVRHLKAKVIVVALDDRRGKLPIDLLLRCRIQGLRIEEGASVLERLTGQIPTKNLRPSWLVFSQGFNESRLMRRLKYAGEFIIALLALLLILPLLVLVAVAVKLSSKGPAIYSQERVGWRGQNFRLLKFRTMRQDAEVGTGPVWASGEDDPRITRLGKLLRKTRLDELPQLVNVLRGEMSFVGPRPERPHFVNALRQVIPLLDERHTVRPGITGWAQIRCGYGSSIEDAEQKLQFDLYYIKHMSIAFDVAIVIDTLKVMVVGRGAR